MDTAEGLAAPGELNDFQRAFSRNYGLQFGYCTPGIMMSVTDFLERTPLPDEDEICDMLSGHLCRCTGYVGMVKAVLETADERAAKDKVD